MKATPLELAQANEYVAALHRHHAPVWRDKMRFGVLADDGHLCGVIQMGRPVSRMLDDGKTIEVLRCCTDGTKNACSFLYSRAARIAEIMGYHKIITYILATENGASLRASGWHLEAEGVGGGSWDRASRPRQAGGYPTEKKSRYAKTLEKKACEHDAALPAEEMVRWCKRCGVRAVKNNE